MIIKTKEQYSYDNGFLNSNAGDWKTGEIEFTQGSTTASTIANICTYSKPLAGVDQFTFSNFDWAANGFSVGDVLNCSCDLDTRTENFAGGFWTPGTSTIVVQTFPVTIATINGNTITLVAAPVVSNPTYPFATALNSPTLMPGTTEYINVLPTSRTAYEYLNVVIENTSRPDTVEFIFNLAENGTTSELSVIDGEVNKFTLSGVDALGIGVPTLMPQSINKSGGYFGDVTLTKVIENADSSTDYRINFEFFDWGIIESGFIEPSYYNSADQLIPVTNITTTTTTGGADILISTNASQNSTGGYDESFNGGANPFITQSIEWRDSFGVVINGLDYSGVSTFKAVIFTNGNQTVNSRYKIGLAWRPEDSTVYQNKPTNIAENLLINAPDVLYELSGVPSGNYHNGTVSPSGAKWDISELQFTQVGLTLEVSGKITPNAQCDTLFSPIPNGGRKTTLWVSLGSTPFFNGSIWDVSQADRVSLKIFDEDNIDAPVIGKQIPDVVEEDMIDHGGNTVIGITGNDITTEDDVLYTSGFLLPDNVVYDSFRFSITAFNTATGDEFVLEQGLIDFNTVVIQSGQYQPNVTQSRGFNLPPTSDRNMYSLKRKAALDVPGKYGIEFQYGFLSDWRYWVSDSNVDNAFFSPNPNANPIPPGTPLVDNHDGKNRNWQEFSSGNWTPRISYFLEQNGVLDFNHLEFNIRPYEDELNVTTTVSFIQLSTGNAVSTPVQNDIHEVTVVFNWTSDFDTEWVEFAVEDFEGGNRWVMSSILPQGNITANPLKPITANTMINVVGTGTTTLTCKALLDTTVVNASQIAFSPRVFSLPNESLISLAFQTNNHFEVDGLFTPSIVKSGLVADWDLGDGSPIQSTNSISYNGYPTNAIKDVLLYLDDVNLVTEIYFVDDEIVGTLDLTVFVNIIRYELNNNPDLTTLVIPANSSAVNRFIANDNDLTGVLDLSGLTNLGPIINLENNPGLTGITNPVTPIPITIYHAFSCGLTGVLDLSTYSSLGGDVRMQFNPNLTGITNPSSSTSINIYFAYDCNLTGTIDLSMLTNLNTDLRLQNNSNLTGVSLPTNANQFNRLWFENCNITFIDFTVLSAPTSINTCSINLQDNGMTSGNVDQTFIDLNATAVGGFVSRFINLGGTNSAATATSLAARNNLISLGFILTFN